MAARHMHTWIYALHERGGFLLDLLGTLQQPLDVLEAVLVDALQLARDGGDVLLLAAEPLEVPVHGRLLDTREQLVRSHGGAHVVVDLASVRLGIVERLLLVRARGRHGRSGHRLHKSGRRCPLQGTFCHRGFLAFRLRPWGRLELWTQSAAEGHYFYFLAHI